MQSPPLQYSRRQELSNAAALLQLKRSQAGRILKGLMDAREVELRLEHYASDQPVDLAQASENKGAYTELMLWRTMIFDSMKNDEEEPRG